MWVWACVLFSHALAPLAYMLAGMCEKEIDKYCKGVEEGDGQLADCISDAIAQTEVPGEGGLTRAL